MRHSQPAPYLRIGEAARTLDLNTSVLRFWEDEFSQLRPERTPKGQRLYSERDMALLFRIRSLLHEQGMTIEGARKVLDGRQEAPAAAPFVSLPADSESAPVAAREEKRPHGEQFVLVASAPGEARPVEVRRVEARQTEHLRRSDLLRETACELRELRDLLRDPSLPPVSAPSEADASTLFSTSGAVRI